MHHHLHSLHLFGCTPCNPLTYLVSDAGTVKDSKSRHNLLVRKQECVLLPSLSLFLSIIFISLHRILRHSYSISFYFELAHEQSIRHSIRHSHSILQVVDIRFDSTTTNLLLYELPCNGIPSFFSYTTRASTKTNTSRIPPF